LTVSILFSGKIAVRWGSGCLDTTVFTTLLALLFSRTTFGAAIFSSRCIGGAVLGVWLPEKELRLSISVFCGVLYAAILSSFLCGWACAGATFTLTGGVIFAIPAVLDG